jgi:hypothetical protein
MSSELDEQWYHLMSLTHIGSGKEKSKLNDSKDVRDMAKNANQVLLQEPSLK